MSEEVDYRALLIKYAQHVLDTEGAHFLAEVYRYRGDFTAAENKALDDVMRLIEAARG